MFSNDVFSQKRLVPPVVVCPVGEHSDLRVPPPSNFRKRIGNGRTLATPNTANIVVNYIGFSEQDQDAQNAFQYAVDIWSTLIKSDVTIYVDATYEELESGVLGAASASEVVKGLAGLPNDSTYYPIALAEKMIGKGINEPGLSDINASFSSEADWYFGIDGETPEGLIDFVTVVLHELGHGLGFVSYDNYDSGIGLVFPGAYSNYIVDNNGTSIFAFPNESVRLGDFLTNENLFLNATQATIANGDVNPKIYAPTNYNGGSSISHWDESTYNGTSNALMTPQVGSGESIHDPGANMMGLFADMGWVHTRLAHQPKTIVDNFTDDIHLVIEVISDTTLIAEEPTIHYSFDGFETQMDVLMTDMGSSRYEITIANPGTRSTLEYYIDGVTDVLNRNYFSPSSQSNRHKVLIDNWPSVVAPFTLTDGGNFEGISNFRQLPLRGNTMIWEQGAPSNVLNEVSSGTQAWKTDLDANLLIPDTDFATALITPKIDLSDHVADYVLQFDLSMDIETPAAGLGVLYSVDGGITWLDLGKTEDGRGDGWYNYKDVDSYFFTKYAWSLDNTDEAPQTVYYNLSEIVGEGQSEVYFAFVFSMTNGYIEEVYDFDGVMIDDFQITKTEPRASFYVQSGEINFPGKEVPFSFTSNGADSYSWDFGDGNTSEEKNPIHIYQNGGSYDVTLDITYPNGTHSNTVNSAISIINRRTPTYDLEDGGNMEIANGDFRVDNVSGTPFELGMSTVAGKNGTTSGENAWVTGISTNEYQNKSVAYLYSPLFDFSKNGVYKMSFMANYSFENRWDGFIMEYSLDLGDNWHQLKPEVTDNWYDAIAIDNEEQGWPDIPLFTGTTNEFVEKVAYISELSQMGDIAFRVYFKSDYAEEGVGMAFDDFSLTFEEPEDAIPNFSFSGDTGCSGQKVIFTDTSTGNILDYSWDFGDGASPEVATGEGPHEVTYTSESSALSSVTLSVTGIQNGVQSITQSNVISSSPTPVATFLEEDNGDDALLKLVGVSGAESYQWYLDGNPVSGATSAEYITSDFGEYVLEVTNGSCVIASSAKVFTPITSIGSIDFNDQISVYPNPSEDGLFMIELPTELKSEASYTVYSLIGSIVKTQSVRPTGSALVLDLSNLVRGTYLLKIATDSEIGVKKLVID